MNKLAKTQPRQPREIGLNTILKTIRITPKISGDFASSVMGKYLGTENYRNFFARMVFHMLPGGKEKEERKAKSEVVHHTHVYNRYVRVYRTVHSAPVYHFRYLKENTTNYENRVHPVLQIVDGHAEIKNIKKELSTVQRELKREQVSNEILKKEIRQEKLSTEELRREIERERISTVEAQRDIEREFLNSEIIRDGIERELQSETIREGVERELQTETVREDLERELQSEIIREGIDREQLRTERVQKIISEQTEKLRELRSQIMGQSGERIEDNADAGTIYNELVEYILQKQGVSESLDELKELTPKELEKILESDVVRELIALEPADVIRQLVASDSVLQQIYNEAGIKNIGDTAQVAEYYDSDVNLTYNISGDKEKASKDRSTRPDGQTGEGQKVITEVIRESTGTQMPVGSVTDGTSVQVQSGNVTAGTSAQVPSGSNTAGTTAQVQGGSNTDGSSAQVPGGSIKAGASAQVPSSSVTAGTTAQVPSGSNTAGTTAQVQSGSIKAGTSTQVQVDEKLRESGSQIMGQSGEQPEDNSEAGPQYNELVEYILQKQGISESLDELKELTPKELDKILEESEPKDADVIRELIASEPADVIRQLVASDSVLQQIYNEAGIKNIGDTAQVAEYYDSDVNLTYNISGDKEKASKDRRTRPDGQTGEGQKVITEFIRESTGTQVPVGSVTDGTSVQVPSGSNTAVASMQLPGGSIKAVTTAQVQGGSNTAGSSAQVPGRSITAGTTAQEPSSSVTAESSVQVQSGSITAGPSEQMQADEKLRESGSQIMGQGGEQPEDNAEAGPQYNEPVEYILQKQGISESLDELKELTPKEPDRIPEESGEADVIRELIASEPKDADVIRQLVASDSVLQQIYNESGITNIGGDESQVAEYYDSDVNLTYNISELSGDKKKETGTNRDGKEYKLQTETVREGAEHKLQTEIIRDGTDRKLQTETIREGVEYKLQTETVREGVERKLERETIREGADRELHTGVIREGVERELHSEIIWDDIDHSQLKTESIQEKIAEETEKLHKLRSQIMERSGARIEDNADAGTQYNELVEYILQKQGVSESLDELKELTPKELERILEESEPKEADIIRELIASEPADVIRQLIASDSVLQQIYNETGIINIGGDVGQVTEYYDSDVNLTYNISEEKKETSKDKRTRPDGQTGEGQKVLTEVIRESTGTQVPGSSNTAEPSAQVPGSSVMTESSPQVPGSSNTAEPSAQVPGSSNTVEPSPQVPGSSITAETSMQVPGRSAMAESSMPVQVDAEDFAKEPKPSRPLRSFARMGEPEVKDGMWHESDGTDVAEGIRHEYERTDVIRDLTSVQNTTLRNVDNLTLNVNATDEPQEIVQYYDSNLNLVYYTLPDGTRVEVDQSGTRGNTIISESRGNTIMSESRGNTIMSESHQDKAVEAADYRDITQTVKEASLPMPKADEPEDKGSDTPYVNERVMIRNIMHYLHGNSKMLTEYNNLLSFLGNDKAWQTSTEMADFPSELSFRNTGQIRYRHILGQPVRILRGGKQVNIPTLRVLLKHFNIRQTRDINRVFENGNAGGKVFLFRKGNADGRRNPARGRTVSKYTKKTGTSNLPGKSEWIYTPKESAGRDEWAGAFDSSTGRVDWMETPDLTYEIELTDTEEWLDTPELGYANRGQEWPDTPELGYARREQEWFDTPEPEYAKPGEANSYDSEPTMRLRDRDMKQDNQVDSNLTIRRNYRELVQRQTSTENKEMITRLMKRLSAVEEQQEIGESEYANAAETVRRLQDELLLQRENVERLTQENQNLAADLKAQKERKISDQRLVELFDNSGHLDRQRYGMTDLY